MCYEEIFPVIALLKTSDMINSDSFFQWYVHELLL